MSFNDRLMMVLTGSVVSLAIMQPSTAYALTGVEVNEIARNVTVLIKAENGDGHGSGVIIAKSDKTYYVLTAHHVVNEPGKYRVVTGDKDPHQLDEKQIKALPGTDLAVVQFSSNKEYKIAKLATSNNVKQGQSIYVTGWPAPSQSIPEITRQFVPGGISSLLEKPVADGYSIVYQAVTRRGMSGGPVFDTEGRVIGIHGLGDAETRESIKESVGNIKDIEQVADFIKSGFNLAIPINTFLQAAPQQGLFLSLQVENTPAVEQKAAYNPPANNRDSLNLGNVMNKAIEGAIQEGIGRGVRKLFRL